MGMVCLIWLLLYNYVITVVFLEIYKQDNIVPKNGNHIIFSRVGQGVSHSFFHYIDFIIFIHFITYHLQLQLHNLQYGPILSNVWLSSLSFL